MSFPCLDYQGAIKCVDISGFTRAAVYLSQAAAALSNAAQTMAMAAEAFSDASLEIKSIIPSSQAISGTGSSASGTVSHEQKHISRDSADWSSKFNPSIPRAFKDAEVQADAPTNLEDNDSYMSDGDDDYIHALLKRQQEERRLRESVTNIRSTEPNVPLEYTLPASPQYNSTLTRLSTPVSPAPVALEIQAPSQARRSILTESEADVLPVVCALLQKYDKGLCYMHCSSFSLTLYQKLIKSVTTKVVYSATSTSPSVLSPVFSAFKAEEKAILLLPETICTNIDVGSLDSLCIIHVGWPHNAEQYSAQISMHDAPHSVVVACASDQEIYPSCLQVLSRTSPWPNEDYILFKKLVTRLRPRFEGALKEIPSSLKDSFYAEWIETHGPRGRRHVNSWTPTQLAERANNYLLDSLQYQVRGAETDPKLPIQAVFPRVSLHFVMQNGLMPAVADGALNVVENDTGLNHPSSLPEADDSNAKSPSRSPCLIPSQATPTSDIPPVIPITTNQVAISSSAPVEETSASERVQIEVPQSPPKRRYSRQRLLIGEEFDILPVVSNIVLNYDKTICYMTCGTSSLALIKTLIHGATGLDVIAASSLESTDILNCINAFNAKQKVVLLLLEDISPSMVLPKTEISCLIHVGWPAKFFNYSAQVANHNSPVSILVANAPDMQLFPSGPQIVLQTSPYPHNDYAQPEQLTHKRNVFEVLLAKETAKSKEQLYTEWIERHGPHGKRYVSHWGPIEFARRANEYLHKILRYQFGPNLSTSSSSKDMLPLLWAGFVTHHGLQPAAQAGILNVVTPEPITQATATAAPALASALGSTSAPTPTLAAPPVHNAVSDKPEMNTKGKPQNITTSAAQAKIETSAAPSKESATIPVQDAVRREYLVYESEFDSIPAMCYLAKAPEHKNTICYIKEIFVMQALAPLIKAMTGKPVFSVSSQSTDILLSAAKACDSPTGCIVLYNAFFHLSEHLRDKPFSQAIHIGWNGNTVLYKEQTGMPNLTYSSLFFTRSEFSAVPQSEITRIKANGLQPGSSLSSRLDDSREKWRAQLKQAPSRMMNRCYMDWMMYYFDGPHKIKSWSALDVVNHANDFMIKVLSRGAQDSPLVPLLGGPPSVTSGFARHLKLQPAVEAGILRVDP